MHIEGEDGSKIELKLGYYAVFGRGAGFNTKDRSISRHHILFHLEKKTENQTQPRVSFQVIGKNPIWVRTSFSNESGEIKVLRRFQKGELAVGDWFCLPSETQNPVWFTLKEWNGVGEESFQLFHIDPVKEFGFLVTGHEFDCYPKGKICDAKKWNWFLEEEGGQDSEDDERLGRKGKKGGRRKRRKGGGGDDDDDDDWRVESDEDKEVVGKKRKVESVKKYSTRSKEGKKKTDRERKRKEHYERSTRVCSNKDVGEDDNDDDNDDDTLGGFIVNDDEEEQEEESDEEEEFTDDDEEEEDEELDD